ncbi:ubiquitin carboxyl-terminal hydrolase-domain-containing protein [Scheffersomyces xylosifermentans]|uniref:ubiquitin carboxyl-terminal hydrolase-domain-containing protein n=1 Tax=Scheffersomyces xylosifermentans TaxID=1304137 RepID=UPI00315D21A1
MDGWTEIARIAATASPKTGPSMLEAPNITSLKFDTAQNLLWCGDSSGYTRSFTPAQSSNGVNPYQQQFQLLPYTKFKASFNNAPVTKHLSHKDGILSLSSNCVNFNNRRGLAKLSLSCDSFVDANSSLFKSLTCFTTNCNTMNDIVVGTNLSLLKFDLNKPTHLTSFNHDGNIALINQMSKFLTLGKANGVLELFDPVSNSSVKSFQGHTGLLSDLDVQGNYIATCGYSVRPRRYNHGNSNSLGNNDYMVDPLVNIYDVRMMRAIAPIPFPAGATSVRFHPKLPNIIIISSGTGQLQFVDIYDQSNLYLYQADLLPPNQPQQPQLAKNPYLANLEVSENGDFLCFNDSYSFMHLWSLNNSGTSSSKDFVNFPSSIEQPDVIMPSNDHIGVDDMVPLSAVGMPYYKDLLLSNFASDLRFTKELARLPDKIDDDLRMEGEAQVGFFPYDKVKYGPANIYKKYQSLKERSATNSNVSVPKFISERGNALSKTVSNTFQNLARKDNNDIFQYKVQPASAPSSSGSNSSIAVNRNKIPNCYTILQIQYSKFGVKDFDFSYYNRTDGLYCGLENHTDNSYVNSLLQLYKFQPVFHNLLLGNLLHEWLPSDFETIMTKKNPQGSSILNELGYLYDMMNKARDKNVNIVNFSQVLNQNKTAQGQNLINKNEGQNLNSQMLRNLIISFNKFLIAELFKDLMNQIRNASMSELMTVHYEIEVRGSGPSCPIYDKQYGSQFTLDLLTPPSNILNKMSILLNPHINPHQPQPVTPTTTRRNHNVITYLEYTINQYKTIPCQQHQHSYPHTLEIKTSVTKLPPLLSINVNLSNEEFKLVNGFKKWLLPEFYVLNNNTDNPIAFKPVLTQFDQDSTKYDLLGYVCEISHQSDLSLGAHNLVSFIKIEGKWYLFNDFLVMPIPEDEVFNLSYPWKKPVILLYQDSNIANTPFEYFKPETFANLPNLNDSILYRDHFAGTIRESYKKEYELLTRDEAPGFGTLVALDAEFVTLTPEELEIRYDGRKKMIKPKLLSLARLSVLHGDNGAKQSVAFIDDYVVHTCEIYDYLTNFSGIEPGDLDPIKSEKRLVTLQTVYRKLWLLLNLGVVFVGHGLYNDFRGINLQVPPTQIRDTADFYYKSDFKRQLSLKFLAYVLLKEKVQTGNHDSIEDANTALLLYKKYIELNATGEFESALNYIYSEGQLLRFRVPE